MEFCHRRLFRSPLSLVDSEVQLCGRFVFPASCVLLSCSWQCRLIAREKWLAPVPTLAGSRTRTWMRTCCPRTSHQALLCVVTHCLPTSPQNASSSCSIAWSCMAPPEHDPATYMERYEIIMPPTLNSVLLYWAKA